MLVMRRGLLLTCISTKKLRPRRLPASPVLLQLQEDRPEPPAGFFADLVEDGEHFGLFLAVGEDRAGGGEAADGDGGDAAVAGVGYDAADLVGVVELGGAVLVAVVGVEGVDLGEDTHGCVVE